MRLHGLHAKLTPFRPDWQYIEITDVACRKQFCWRYGMSEAEKKSLALRRLPRLSEKQLYILAALADIQNHIMTLLLVMKQQVYQPVLKIGLVIMGDTPTVKSFLTEFLNDTLLAASYPLVQDIKQAPIKVPAHREQKVDYSIHSLEDLQDMVKAAELKNSELHDNYREHCRVVEQLLAIMTYKPDSIYSLGRQINRIACIPQHQLPCSSATAFEWCEEVTRRSHLFLFRDPSTQTRADLGPVEASCVCLISDDLEAAPDSMQSHGSSGSASCKDHVYKDDSGSSSGSSSG